MPVKSLPLSSIARHVVLPAVALLLTVAVFFAIRWYLGNAISARVEQSERVPPRELAQLAARWAPADPQTHYAMAVLDEKSFRLEDVPRALSEFERATALSPNDYRLWLALGQARDRAGEADGAIAALREALRLAPHYAPVQWALSNVLLRRGAEEEAFALVRRAVESDPKFTEPALSVVWQLSGGDLSRVTQAVGDSAQVKSALSVFLAKQKLYEQAFASWNALAEADKKENFRANTDELLKQLLNGKKYRAALTVQTQIAAGGAANQAAAGAAAAVAAEKITNPGFEAVVNTTGAGVFEWQIAEGLQPVVAFDETQKRGGARSLVIAFNSGDGKDFRGVQQTVVVAPDQKYKFEVFFRSDLNTSATVKWEILNAGDGNLLAATQAAPSDSADWAALKTEFTTPADVEAVTIRLARAPCGSIICPIAGKIWFDDFSLQ